ncbi:hypothetical protein ABZ249_16655 [Nocardiopsis sp. NPDC006139]|uniref:hypothetical protein n=1 Tax=Nocardiopsis sp. NPDC006139 TaxID=3154578 RepID=UPI0033A94FBC
MDDLARMTAVGMLRLSPWTTTRIPLAVFVVFFGLNVASLTAHFSAPSPPSDPPWINLLGVVFFLLMAVAHPTAAAAQRENAHAFLHALDRAEWERSGPEGDR